MYDLCPITIFMRRLCDAMIRFLPKQHADKNCRRMESAKISSCSLDYKRCQKASFQGIKRKIIYSDRQPKSPLIFIYRILSFARGRFRSIGQSRSLPGQPTSPSRTLDEHLSSSSRALLTQHGNKVVNQNVQTRPTA